LTGSSLLLNGSLTNSGNILIDGTIDCKDNIITGTGTFTLKFDGTLKTSNVDGIAPNGSSGSIQTSTRIFANSANYEYNGTSSQVTGTGLPTTIGGNLVIDNPSGVSLQKSVILTGSNNSISFGTTLTINSPFVLNLVGTLNLDGSIENNGTIAGVGTIVGNLNNTGGKLAPGNSPGTMHITGDYDGRGATHNFELSHNIGYDKLAITGDIQLDNTSILNISFTGNTPDVTDVFDIFTFDGIRTGSFLPANITYPDGSDFEINYNPQSITLDGLELPIELQQFSVTKINDFANLKWTSSSEFNNDFYSIERSPDGKEFKEIAMVKAIGSSQISHDYNYTDERPIIGLNYYRLKQVDYDKLYSYSPIRVIDFEKEPGFSIYPTLVTTNLHIQTPVELELNTEIELISIPLGIIALKDVFEYGIKNKEVNISKLIPGCYLARISQNQKIYSQLFIKQ